MAPCVVFGWLDNVEGRRPTASNGSWTRAVDGMMSLSPFQAALLLMIRNTMPLDAAGNRFLSPSSSFRSVPRLWENGLRRTVWPTPGLSRLRNYTLFGVDLPVNWRQTRLDGVRPSGAVHSLTPRAILPRTKTSAKPLNEPRARLLAVPCLMSKRIGQPRQRSRLEHIAPPPARGPSSY